MVSGLQIWMPRKAVTGETPQEGGQGQDGHHMEGYGGGDADEHPQGHTPGQFPGIVLETEEFQPMVAEEASQSHRERLWGPGRRRPRPP